jgi:cytochrome b561
MLSAVSSRERESTLGAINVLRNSETGYGLVAILFHWLIAAMFIGQASLGFYMSDLPPDEALTFTVYQWHKSLGLSILLLAMLRFIWRMSGPEPALPATMPGWEKRAARGAHLFLYAALILVPLTGWALVSASPLDIPTFAFNLVVVPHLPVPAGEAAERLWGFVHELLAKAALLVALIHIGAALRHEFVLRDGLLSRMIRPARR